MNEWCKRLHKRLVYTAADELRALYPSFHYVELFFPHPQSEIFYMIFEFFILEPQPPLRNVETLTDVYVHQDINYLLEYYLQ